MRRVSLFERSGWCLTIEDEGKWRPKGCAHYNQQYSSGQIRKCRTCAAIPNKNRCSNQFIHVICQFNIHVITYVLSHSLEWLTSISEKQSKYKTLRKDGTQDIWKINLGQKRTTTATDSDSFKKFRSCFMTISRR